MRRSLYLVLILFLVSCLPFLAKGQSACSDNTEGKSRAQLEQDLEACNQEIAQWTDTLNKTKNESAGYTRDIGVLTAKINAAQANIKAKNIAINGLNKDINAKTVKINELDGRLVKGKESISEILRKTSEIDSYSLAEAILSNKDFSEFFVDVDTYASTEEALDRLFDEIRGVKAETEAEKLELNKKKEAEAEARAAIEASKKEVEISQADKQKLLAESKMKETAYSQVLADKQKKAAQIKAVLFPLRDAGSIQFGTALQYAQEAEKVTGVRPALVLAILQQESNLGQNVGTCVITNLSSGETKNVNTGKVFSNGIHPTRDLPVLQEVLAKLGGNPLTTKVSCPLSIGYGGGMGPAQFIPSTWKLMESQIGKAVGKETPNPWDPRDAIFASSIYLGNLGAGAGGYTAERNAACKYYSGRACASSSAGAGYGNSVMTKATNIQLTMIDPLTF